MNKVKRIAIGAVATGILLASALPAFAVPPGAPADGCPSAFTGGQSLPADGGDPHAIDTNTTDPAPNLTLMFQEGYCTPPSP